MTCINLPTLKTDFIDRSFIFWMDKIDEKQQKQEVKMDAEARQLVPYVFGDCLHILSKARKIHDKVEAEYTNKPKPRLSDFAIWGEAVSRAMGEEKNRFFDAYMALLSGYNMDIVQQYLDIMILLQLVEQKDIEDVTPTTLLQLIKDQVENKDDKRELPKQPNTLSEHLNEVTPNLLKLGYRVRYDRSSIKRTWNITKLNRDKPSPTSAQVTYTPNAEFVGGDSFTFKANDGFVGSNIGIAVGSNTATVSLLVDEVMKGDVTGGGITIDDVISIADIVLGRQIPTLEQQIAADLFPSKAQTGGVTCGDGATDIGDILALVDVILNRTSIAAQCG